MHTNLLKKNYRFLIDYYFSYLDSFSYSIILLVTLLVSVAFFTLADRKAMASIQRRKGPNVVGFWGFLQPFADGLKLLIKEIVMPNKINKFCFLFGSWLSLFLSLINWVVIPYNPFNIISTCNVGLLYIFVVSSLNVYGILLAGWSSNSKYSLLGSLRCISQMISYEIAIGLITLPVALFSNSLNLNEIVLLQMQNGWFILPFWPLSLIFLISVLAETNRIPFDLPEAEAELVAGYNVEYSAFTFGSFFLGEYSNILMMSSTFVTLFLGGGDCLVINSLKISLYNNSFFCITLYDFFFSFKIILVSFFFVFIRANFPRFRFDQLMLIGWKILLPFLLSSIIFTSGLLFAFGDLDIIQIPRFNSHYFFTLSNATH